MINFGGDHHIITASKVAQRTANNLFTAAVRIAICSIEKIDAAFEGTLNNRSAAIFGKRPGVFTPVRLTERHTAQAEAGNPKVGLS